MEKRLKHSQALLIALCVFTYIVSYLSRYSYNSNVTAILEAYSISKSEAGIVGTFFFFAYGAGSVVHGLFCRHYPKRFVIPGALIVSGILNALLFMRPSFMVYKWLWMINGAVLSLLWPSIISLLGEQCDATHLGRAQLALTTPVALGTALSYGTSALFCLNGEYFNTFLFVSILAVATAIAWFFIYPCITVKKETAKPEVKRDGETKKRAKTRGFPWILCLLGFLAIFMNLIKDGLGLWAPDILKETYGFGDSLSIGLTVILPVIGMFGSLFAMTFNRYVKSYQVTCAVFFGLGALLLGILSATMELKILALVLVGFGLMITLTHGLNNLITSVAPLDLRDSYDSGKISGILNGCCYVGSTISSYGLAALSENLGWTSTLWILAGCCLFCSVLAALSLLKKKRSRL